MMVDMQLPYLPLLKQLLLFNKLIIFIQIYENQFINLRKNQFIKVFKIKSVKCRRLTEQSMNNLMHFFFVLSLF